MSFLKPTRKPKPGRIGAGCGFGQQQVFFSYFFSSRRRHTIFQGDWSSDVCSSDLFTGVGWAHSAVIRKIRFVLGSRVDVLAPTLVATFCSTSKVDGLISFTTVNRTE